VTVTFNSLFVQLLTQWPVQMLNETVNWCLCCM